MSDTAEAHPVLEPEPPALQERNIWVGARLLVSSTIFLFLPLVFGYLYLATLNTGGLWRPGDLKGPIGWGIPIMLALLFSAGLLAWARSELLAGNDGRFRWYAVGALLLGLAAVVLQIVEYTQLGFGPTDGGFASVFVGWTGLLGVVTLLTMVWLETVVASSFRNGNHSPGSSQNDVDAVVFYLAFLAILGAFTFAFLYLV
ncbi:MAG TPA: cytochrome c oxidase subunit 3 [Gaiellaceae bacterium]|nr:cytochrome c oxidase subunit 3 [Gaiellaceae bacterium]